MPSTVLTDYTVRVKKFAPTDPRLGRHVRHDSRSLSPELLYPEADPATLVSARHVSAIPVFDQGQLGSCTGNASTKCATYPPLWTEPVQAVLSTSDAKADEIYAVGVYSDASKIDSAYGTYPPTDTGSDGISVAKVLQTRGLISGYKHATTLDAVLNALQTQAVIVGTNWTTDMFNPDADGRLHPTGSAEGGHEYVLDEIDVENKRVWMQNSWGTAWGVDNGRAYFTWDDFATLLASEGDCTIFIPSGAAPTPAPPAPAPTPGPVNPNPPAPANPDQTLADTVADWLKHKKFSKSNEVVRQALLAWLKAKNLA